jgi:hypothetical protein
MKIRFYFLVALMSLVSPTTYSWINGIADLSLSVQTEDPKKYGSTQTESVFKLNGTILEI